MTSHVQSAFSCSLAVFALFAVAHALDVRQSEPIDLKDPDPSTFMSANNATVDMLKSQAAAAKSQASALSVEVAQLAGQVQQANQALQQAQSSEYAQWSLAKQATDARQSQDVNTAVATATWNSKVTSLNDELQRLSEAARAEYQVRSAKEAEAYQKEMQAALAAQKAAQAATERQKMEAFWQGSEMQKKADRPIIQGLTDSVREAQAVQAANTAFQAKTRAAAMAAGKAVGELAGNYSPNSAVGKAVMRSLADATLTQQALEAQKAAAESAGVNVKEVVAPGSLG